MPLNATARPLLLKPARSTGLVHHLKPATARRHIGCESWGYVGFSLYRLNEGQFAAEQVDARESILVFVQGRGEVTIGETLFGEQGDRLNVFERRKPVAIYVPANTRWSVRATTDDCELAVCRAPELGGGREARVLDDIRSSTRGTGSNERFINAIAMEEQDVADSLLVTEVFTPGGNWSSYPPHRHDEDDFPNITYLEETYYHRISPGADGSKGGFAFQRVFTEDGTLDESLAAEDGDLVLVPKGHHPVAAGHGYESYYLNVMAGPQRRWRFKNHPDHDWIAPQTPQGPAAS